MQYILDEVEMEEIRELRAKMQKLPSIINLQKMCTKIANEWAVWRGWEGKSDPTPWGCVITYDEGWYCDNCPVRSICPKEYKPLSK